MARERISRQAVVGKRHAPLLILVVGVGLASCGGAPAQEKGPLLNLELNDERGQKISARDFRGRVLIVHVFTTWSMPSQDDALRLQAAFGNSERVAVLGVALDNQAETVIAAWRRGMGVTYPIAVANDLVRYGETRLGNPRAVPYTAVYDETGHAVLVIRAPLGERGVEEIRKRAGLPAGSN